MAVRSVWVGRRRSEADRRDVISAREEYESIGEWRTIDRVG